MDSFPEITLVIPTHNDADRLARKLETCRSYMEGVGLDNEIVIVDMRSGDRTVEVVREVLADHPRARVLLQQRSWGKGAAVRAGALRARGHFILVSDPELSVPIQEEAKLRGVLIGGADVAIGVRPDSPKPSQPSPGWRRISLERSLGALPRRMGLTPVRDTQCGFRMFRRQAAQALFSRNRIDGIASDVEILLLASRCRMDVAQVPVRWLPERSSLRHPLTDPARMVVDLMRLRRSHRKAVLLHEQQQAACGGEVSASPPPARSTSQE